MRSQIHRTDLVMVLPTLGPGGTERVAANLANYWASRGRRVRLILTEPQAPTFYTLHSSIVVLRVAYGSWTKLLRRTPILSSIFSVLFLRKQIRQSTAERVLSFLPHSNTLVLIATLNLGLLTIISERNDLSRRHLPWFWDRLRRITYWTASKIIINLESNRSILSNWCSPDQIVNVPNPVEIPHPLTSCDRDQTTFLAVGRLSEQKAFHLLLNAFSKSQCCKSGWHLRIIGDGEERSKLLKQIDALHLNNQVTIIPNSNDIWSEYLRFQYFVMPSNYEGTPNALIEAISSGMIPIVSTGVGDLCERIRRIEPRLVFPNGDENKLREVLNLAYLKTKFKYDTVQSKERLIRPYQLEHSMPVWTKIVFDE